MRKGKLVIGKDVISFTDAAKLHSVKDLVVSHDNATVVALVVDEGGLFGGSTQVIPMANVVNFGKDAVVVADRRVVVRADSFPAVKQILDRRDKLIGKPVYTEGGERQGTVDDVYFDEQTGQIVAFELSRGTLGNVAQGTLYLPVEHILNVGQDVVFIRAEAAHELREQTGGLQAAAGAGETALAPEDLTAEAALGRRAHKTIQGGDGSIVVPAGKLIEEGDVEQARRAGKTDELLASAGLREELPGGEGADALGQAAGKAGSLWDNFVLKLSQFTDNADRQLEEANTRTLLERINDAVGRPVTKVILDRRDDVILNTGDIITHEAVQRAHDAGLLDNLLDNVYIGELQLSKEELRAPQEGQATVQKAHGDARIVQEIERKVDRTERRREAEDRRKKEKARAEREERVAALEGRIATREEPGDASAQPAAETGPQRGAPDDYTTDAASA